jgi:replicative DNA helicase
MIGAIIVASAQQHSAPTVECTYANHMLRSVNQLDACGGAAYLSELLDHALPENIDAYVRNLLKASQERRYAKLEEWLIYTKTHEERLDILRQMQEVLTETREAQNWRALFHTYEETMNAPSARFAIDGFLRCQLKNNQKKSNGISFV